MLPHTCNNDMSGIIRYTRFIRKTAIRLLQRIKPTEDTSTSVTSEYRVSMHTCMYRINTVSRKTNSINVQIQPIISKMFILATHSCDLYHNCTRQRLTSRFSFLITANSPLLHHHQPSCSQFLPYCDKQNQQTDSSMHLYNGQLL